MTAGNNGNGTGTPENEDPFGYLYRSEGGEADTDAPAARQPGVPRTSYNQVRPVGSRQYGQPAAAQQRPHPHYAAPETLPGGASPQPPTGYAAGPAAPARPKRRGPLIAAIAVVAVVAGGIGVAMLTNNSSSQDDKQNSASEQKSGKGDSSGKGDDSKKSGDEPKNPSVNGQTTRDAASLKLSGGATTEKTQKGAKAEGGTYITGMNAPGAAVEWTVDVKEPGQYRLNLRYGVPGKDANLTVWQNGDKNNAIKMNNYGAKPGDYSDMWFTSWVNVQLNKGTNTLKLSCEPGNSCDTHLDQVWLTQG